MPAHARRTARSLQAGFAGAMTALAAGCAAAPDAGPSPDDVPRPFGVGEHGLAMRTWVVDDNPDHVVDVLRQWSQDDAPSADDAARAGSASDSSHDDVSQLQTEAMTRNGLFWARVPVDALDDLGEQLGGRHRNIRTWHGQQHHWAPAYRHHIRTGGEAVAIDGRVRRFDDGRLRLMIRGWTLPTEHGPRFYVELMPMHRPPGRNVDHLLLERRPDPAEPFTTMGLHATLDSGWAYVLTGLPPDMIVEDDDDGGSDAEARVASDPAGPDADLPGTFGETLFRTRATPRQRVIIVLIPSIPDELFPEPLEVDEGGEDPAEPAAS